MWGSNLNSNSKAKARPKNDAKIESLVKKEEKRVKERRGT
jgi:hypothetical protein